MLQPIKHILSSKNIILASASPRRKEILERNLGLNIKIIPSKFKEDLEKSKFESPVDYVLENSRLKALDVANSIKSNDDWLIVIGSDTVVAFENKIFEKPVDKEDAFKMIKTLSNSTHMVYTGVTLVQKMANNFKLHSFYEGSQVKMTDISDEVINAYIETGEPLDKAGGYGIQDLGATLVQSINGDFFNVEGFPAHKFAIELKKFLNIS